MKNGQQNRSWNNTFDRSFVIFIHKNESEQNCSLSQKGDKALEKHETNDLLELTKKSMVPHKLRRTRNGPQVYCTVGELSTPQCQQTAAETQTSCAQKSCAALPSEYILKTF